MSNGQPPQPAPQGQPQPRPAGAGGFVVQNQPGLEPSVASTALKIDDVLLRIERLLRGYVYEGYNRWMLPKNAIAYMNEKGISYTMLNLTMLHSRITTLANKQEEQAFYELYAFMAHYCIWLRVRARSIAFDTQYYHSFCAMMASTLSSTYSRAMHGDDKGFILGLHPEGLRNLLQGKEPSGGTRDLFKM